MVLVIVGDSKGIHIFYNDTHIRSIQSYPCRSVAMTNEGYIVAVISNSSPSFFSMSGQNFDPQDDGPQNNYKDKIRSWCCEISSSVFVDGQGNCYVRGKYQNTHHYGSPVVIFYGTSHIHWNRWSSLTQCSCTSHMAIDKNGFIYLACSLNSKNYVYVCQ